MKRPSTIFPAQKSDTSVSRSRGLSNRKVPERRARGGMNYSHGVGEPPFQRPGGTRSIAWLHGSYADFRPPRVEKSDAILSVFDFDARLIESFLHACNLPGRQFEREFREPCHFTGRRRGVLAVPDIRREMMMVAAR